MQLVINGEPRDCPGVESIADVLAALSLEAAAVVVEHNGTIIDRGAYAEVSVAGGDRLELVQIVGGG